MKVTRLISAVDVWAAGGPHRIVTGGLPPIKGGTLRAKQQFIRDHFPDLPRTLTAAPDDHPAMVAAILTEPCDPQADFGVLWMGSGELMNLCGTGTFAIGTMLCELGMVPVSDGMAEVVLEIPVGLQQLQIHIRDRSAVKVVTRTSPAYYEGDYAVLVAGQGEVPLSIAFGLNCLEPLIDCDALGIELTAENAGRLAELGRRIRRSLQDSSRVPPAARRGVQLSFYQNSPQGSDADFRCMAIVGQGAVDTTPSGTSSCAQLAMRFAKGQIKVGEELRVESITGGRLGATVVAATSIEGRAAVIPEISGQGRVTRIQSIPF